MTPQRRSENIYESSRTPQLPAKTRIIERESKTSVETPQYLDAGLAFVGPNPYLVVIRLAAVPF